MLSFWLVNLLFVIVHTFPLQEVPKDKWFCHPACLRNYSALQKLVVHGQQKLPDSLLNIIKEKHGEKGPANGGLDVKWRVLSGKTSTGAESLELLSKALAIFHVSRLVICYFSRISTSFYILSIFYQAVALSYSEPF